MKSTLIPLMFAIVALPMSLQAETIRTDVGSQSPEMHNIERPQAGATKQEVEALYGTPLRQTTVGTPAITTWRYENFSVYFEGDTVLHSVLVKTKP